MTNVKMTVTHDKLACCAKYASGCKVSFTIARGRETLSITPAAGQEVKINQDAMLAEFQKELPGDTNGARIERIGLLLGRAVGLDHLARLISGTGGGMA